MHVDPKNEIIYNKLKTYIARFYNYFKCTRLIAGREKISDYDNFSYEIGYYKESSLIKFSFNCYCFKDIMANGGQEMLETTYKGKIYSPIIYIDYIVDEKEKIEGYNYTLGIKTNDIPDVKRFNKLFINCSS